MDQMLSERVNKKIEENRSMNQSKVSNASVVPAQAQETKTIEEIKLDNVDHYTTTENDKLTNLNSPVSSD